MTELRDQWIRYTVALVLGLLVLANMWSTHHEAEKSRKMIMDIMDQRTEFVYGKLRGLEANKQEK